VDNEGYIMSDMVWISRELSKSKVGLIAWLYWLKC